MVSKIFQSRVKSRKKRSTRLGRVHNRLDRRVDRVDELLIDSTWPSLRSTRSTAGYNCHTDGDASVTSLMHLLTCLGKTRKLWKFNNGFVSFAFLFLTSSRIYSYDSSLLREVHKFQTSAGFFPTY